MTMKGWGHTEIRETNSPRVVPVVGEVSLLASEVLIAAAERRPILPELERYAAAVRADVAENHIPSGGTGMDGYGYVVCSCGWTSDTSSGTTWTDHISPPRG